MLKASLISILLTFIWRPISSNEHISNQNETQEASIGQFQYNLSNQAFSRRLEMILDSMETLNFDQAGDFEAKYGREKLEVGYTKRIGESYYPSKNQPLIDTCYVFLYEDSLITNKINYYGSKNNGQVWAVLMEWVPPWEKAGYFDEEVALEFKKCINFIDCQLEKYISKPIDSYGLTYSDTIIWMTHSGCIIHLESGVELNRAKIRLIIYKN